MKTAILSLCALLALSGCGGKAYQKYLEAQLNLTTAALKNHKPLVKITAEEGQAITGLASIEVYAPQAMPQVQQQRPNEWASTIERVAVGALTLGGTKIAADAAIGLTREVGRAANHGYEYVNPTPVIAPDPVIVPPADPILVPPPEVVIVPPQPPILVPTPVWPPSE